MGKNKKESLSDSQELVVQNREMWDSKLDFMLSCIGYAVGLGNIWRFPYLCYKNGGGAFLIPYFTFFMLCGVPLFFLELSFGQFGALGPVAIWKISPLFKGIGYAMLGISFTVCVYYNVIIAYTLHFIFNSFKSVLPWSTCDNYWNRDTCRDKTTNISHRFAPDWVNITCQKGEGWFANKNVTFVNFTTIGEIDQTTVTLKTLYGNETTGGVYINGSCYKYTTPSQEYFSHKVLRITDNIDQPGGIQWELVGCLLLAWLLVFVCLFKGVKWSGKVVYFTATFPYVVLLILLVRGAMEEGASIGIYYYLYPDVSKLRNIEVWAEAAVQIFYSLGAAWGVILNYSSFNRFNNNVFRDALCICSINCLTSLLSGFVVFSVLGSLAFQSGRNITEVVDQGAGLAFVAYPAAVSNLPISPLWAFLFFFMLLNLGLDSQFGMIEAVIKGLFDEFKVLRSHRVKFLAGMCILQFLLALPMVTESGMYWVTLIDWYCAGFSLMIVAILEIVCISWIYGVDRFLYDISCMIGSEPPLSSVWRVLWLAITPLCIFALIITSIIYASPATYNEKVFPSWAIAVGWLSCVFSVSMIPIWAIYQIITHPRAKGTFWERVKELTKCDDDWGPHDPNVPYKYRIKAVVAPKKSNKMDMICEEEVEHLNSDSTKSTSSESSTSTGSNPPNYHDVV